MWQDNDSGDSIPEMRLSELSEMLRKRHLGNRGEPGKVKRLFGYNVAWGGSDCSSCFFRGNPRYPENIGRCLILEAVGFQGNRAVLPRPCVSLDCPYYVSDEEMVIRASDKRKRSLLLRGLRERLAKVLEGENPVRRRVDRVEEGRNRDSLNKQRYTRTLLQGLEAIGWWNNLSIPIQRRVVADIGEVMGVTVRPRKWDNLDNRERKAVSGYKQQFFTTRFKDIVDKMGGD